MATYTELRTLFSDDALRNLVQVALGIKAHAILQEATPSAERLSWAADNLVAGESQVKQILGYLLADKRSLTIEQIKGATDAAVQTAVDAAIDKLVP